MGVFSSPGRHAPILRRASPSPALSRRVPFIATTTWLEEEDGMPVKVAIIYYSATGITYQLARAVREGAEQAGAEVRLHRVPELAAEEAIASNEGWSSHRLATLDVAEATHDDLLWSDAVIFGTPTRFGNVSAQLKQFIDTTGPLWR